LKRVERVEAFVSTGFCGALEAGLNVGDIFVASDVNGEAARAPDVSAPSRSRLGNTARMNDSARLHTVTAPDVSAPSWSRLGNALRTNDSARLHTVTEARPSGSAFFTGPLISQDRVACSVEEKRALHQTGAAAVEMEAAAVQQVARDAGLPFYCVRVVSDTASETLALDFNRMRDEVGRFSRSRIVVAALRNPLQLFPQLMRLDRNCKSASNALGDFLAHCRF